MKSLLQKLLVLGVLATAALACGGGDEAGSEAPPSANQIDAKRIWKIRCIACHGIDGTMGINGAADLTKSDKDLDYRINIITNGSENGVMTPFGGILNEDEIKAMAQYTLDLKK